MAKASQDRSRAASAPVPVVDVAVVAVTAAGVAVWIRFPVNFIRENTEGREHLLLNMYCNLVGRNMSSLRERTKWSEHGVGRRKA